MRAWCGVLAACVACSGQQTPTTEPPPEPPKPALSPLAEAMQEHWALATWIRDAVVAGRIEDVPKAARLLAEHEPSPAVPDWTPHLDRMREASRAAQSAATLREAAMATAEVASSCGSCHVETGAVVRIALDAAPERSVEPSAHMVRHAWAAQAMWVGVVAPSDDAWREGSAALADRPLHAEELLAGRWVVTEEVAALGTAVHDIGVRGARAESSERAGIYGELIGTCAECHARLAVKIAPP